MSISLHGRVGLVVGVSAENGVGFHCAKSLVGRGARVAMSHRARPGSRGAELASALDCVAVQFDVQDESAVESAVSEVGERFGRLDFVLHAVVHVPDGVLDQPLIDVRRSDFTEVMDIGAYSLVQVVRACLPWLKRSDAASIVTLLSAGGEFAIPNYHVVGIAKAALASTTRYLAAELGPEGVSCNAVSFSMIDTEAARRVIGPETTGKTVDYLAKRSMTRRAVSYDDVAATVAFLCSTDCRNLTGEVLTVDGGYCRNYF